MVELAQREPSPLLQSSHKPIFFCSFGKDSLCVLDLIKEHLKKVFVVLIDCGAMYPEITELADRIGKTLPMYYHYKNPISYWDDLKQFGFPMMVEIPEMAIYNSDALAWRNRQSKCSTWISCMARRVWGPLSHIAATYNPDLIITGERKVDRPEFTQWNKTRLLGRYPWYRPLLEWDDKRVWSYIQEHNIEVPSIYQKYRTHSDCWGCFGGMGSENGVHDFNPEGLKQLKADHPDIYNRLVQEGMPEFLREFCDRLGEAKEKADRLRQIMES